MITKEQDTLYACTTQNNYSVSIYHKNEQEFKWLKIKDLPRSPTDETEVVLQLKLDKDEKILYGTTSNGFVIWHLDPSEDDRPAIVLALPYGIRNISTIMLQSNSIMISGHKNYAIAGVR